MSVPNTSARSTETRHLFRIINTVSSTLDLDQVLRAIVDLVSDAIDCHACFIYLVATDGSLVLRSVSDPYGALVDRLRFEPGEGLAGWVAQNNQPVFLTEGALTDPRAKVVPEADEEEYQSIVAVPLRSKAGDVVGVISLHAEAPREFTEADSDFLVHAASLVAGAIENARLYEHTRRRLALVEGMADLARAVSAASTVDQLLPAVARRAQRLLGRRGLRGVRLARRRRRSSWVPPRRRRGRASVRPPRPTWASCSPAAAPTPATAAAWPSSCGATRPAAALVAPMVAADELLGIPHAALPRRAAGRSRGPRGRDVDRRPGRHRAQEPAADRAPDRAQRDQGLPRGSVSRPGGGGRPGRPRPGARLRPQPPPPGAAGGAAAGGRDAGVGGRGARARVGRRPRLPGVAVRPPRRCRPRPRAARLGRRGGRGRRGCASCTAGLNKGHPLAIGLSHRCEGPASFATGFEEAQHAVTAAAVISPEPGVVSFDDLGAYKYLLRVSQDGRTRDHRGDALKKLEAYDRRHRSQLLMTLEEYLKRRGNIAAAAQTLYVHPNTLRQRLRRIQDLTGLDVQNEDWLMIEIELKLLRLERALGRSS